MLSICDPEVPDVQRSLMGPPSQREQTAIATVTSMVLADRRATCEHLGQQKDVRGCSGKLLLNIGRGEGSDSECGGDGAAEALQLKARTLHGTPALHAVHCTAIPSVPVYLF